MRFTDDSRNGVDFNSRFIEGTKSTETNEGLASVGQIELLAPRVSAPARTAGAPAAIALVRISRFSPFVSVRFVPSFVNFVRFVSSRRASAFDFARS
jgi:hypothetical protein